MKEDFPIRIKATFHLKQPTDLPYNLNYPLSSYLYQCIELADPSFGDWLHNQGIEFRGKSHKPFVFSRIHFDSRQNYPTHMTVKGDCTFLVDSIRSDLIQRLIEGMNKMGSLQLIDVTMPLTDLRIEINPKFQETMTYRSLSPIVVPVKQDARLHFCHPLESPFYDSIRKSLNKWYFFKWGEEIPVDTPIHISVYQPEKFQLKKAAVLTTYKEKKLKGYQVPLIIQAPPRVQQVIYESGLGSYGSQGFGMMGL